MMKRLMANTVNKMLISQIADNTHPALPPVMEVEEADEGILAPVVPPVGDVTLTRKVIKDIKLCLF